MSHAHAVLVVGAQAGLLARERRRLIRREARSEERAQVVAVGGVQRLRRFREPCGELAEVAQVGALRVRRNMRDAREVIGEVGQLRGIHAHMLPHRAAGSTYGTSSRYTPARAVLIAA